MIDIDDYCCNNAWDAICQLTYDYCGGTYTGPLLTRVKEGKELLSITDLLGREVEVQKNIILLYTYSDGTVIKRLLK